MTATIDPAGFDPERTGEMRIPLADTLAKQVPALPTAPAGPALIYCHSRGSAQTLIDMTAPVSLYYDDPDTAARELLIARALLVHALRLVDRELNS